MEIFLKGLVSAKVFKTSLRQIMFKGESWRRRRGGSECWAKYSTWYSQLSFTEHLGFAGRSSKYFTSDFQDNSLTLTLLFPYGWGNECHHRELKWFAQSHQLASGVIRRQILAAKYRNISITLYSLHGKETMILERSWCVLRNPDDLIRGNRVKT